MTTGYRAKWIIDVSRSIEDGYLVVNDGYIEEVGCWDEFRRDDRAGDFDDLGQVAIVPGLVNAHSHSFQRFIRGATEYQSKQHREDDFWTWRNRMYEAANQLTAEQFEAIARLAFVEMLSRGITAVGEFHYIHHRPHGRSYSEVNELSRRMISAAEDVGIRINLLRTGYERAGYKKDPEEGQRRFYEADVKTYLKRFEMLQKYCDSSALASCGLAPHSIRAVSQKWLERIATYGAQNDIPVHIHACEQPRELEEARAEYGKSPIEVFRDVGLMDTNLTIIHGTHLFDRDFDILRRFKPTICACPTTERNLGDGFLEAQKLIDHGIDIALGSDSQANIDLLDEMRLVEYHERLRHQRRNVLVSGEGSGTNETGDILFPMGTSNGSRALDIEAGRLREGLKADFAAIDLDALDMIGATRETFRSHWILSATPASVSDVFVEGKKVVDSSEHVDRGSIVEEARDLYREVISDGRKA